MAYNVIADSSAPLDFNRIHSECFTRGMAIEMFPMLGLGVNGGDAVGICVPFRNANEQAWLELKRVLKLLKSDFRCQVYDLNSGEKLGMFNMDSFRKNLLA